WQGKLEEAAEVAVFFKLTRDGYARFEARLKEMHPYDVPEIIALSLADGLPAYLAWVRENCASAPQIV
ncbi:MAG TPA: divalent-cation tolerance protein CutA, partial [Chthoniobacterales bacterium]